MSFLRRTAETVKARDWATLGLELFLVIAGVLIALAIDSWAQDRRERAVERASLQLLVRDLDLDIEQLREVQGYAAEVVDDGLATYRKLAARAAADGAPGAMDRDVVRRGVNNLTGRLTIRLHQAAYTDLLNTGNLRLIRDRELRDRIVSYYEDAQLIHDAMARNRVFFNDELFAAHVIGQGLVIPYIGDHPVRAIYATVEELQSGLGDDFQHPTARLATLPADAPEWERLRTRVWAMTLANAFVLEASDRMLEDATELRDAVEAALGTR